MFKSKTQVVLFFSLLLVIACSSPDPGEKFVGCWGTIEECNIEFEIEKNGEIFIITAREIKIPAIYEKGVLKFTRPGFGELTAVYDEKTNHLLWPTERGSIELSKIGVDTWKNYVGDWVSTSPEELIVKISKEADNFIMNSNSNGKDENITLHYQNGVLFRLEGKRKRYLIYDKENDLICWGWEWFKRKS